MAFTTGSELIADTFKDIHQDIDEKHSRSLIFQVTFFFFLWPHLWHMEVPKLGIESEL